MHILQDHAESSSLSGAIIRAVTDAPEFESRKTRSATTKSVISLIPTLNQGATSIFAGRLVEPKEIATQYETAIKKIRGSAEFKEFMNRRGFDMIYLDSAKFSEFMKADNKDNGKALKSLGLAK